ncbi:MAG: hypothetical protein A3F13_04100 [Gammaproteobacteria bacterium RIFCSPHIGHO2_12_FULL_40_19]|nr:MAG: hypothetical protein A3F13_04100 [Gammaproteobacteria bacterium RIFCSPHIGHO2_12_FULL_40_19]
MHKPHVLNTRPSHQAHHLTQLIEQRGGRVFHLPVFAIQPIIFEPINLDDFDILIFQSSNAVHAFFQRQKIKSTVAEIIAIGAATKKALNSVGFDRVLVPNSFSSEGILAMPLLQSVVEKSILIMCGENPKSLLIDTLAARGARTTMVHCYQRTPILHNMEIIFPTVMQSNITTIPSTSSEGFIYLMRLFEKPEQRAWILNKTLCVINEKMKMDAEKMGFTSVIQAENATDEAIAKGIFAAYDVGS